jgi:hypothetical protein
VRKLKLPGRNPEGPRLSDEDFQIIEEIGIRGIKQQAEEIVDEKLGSQPKNDGNQTPRAGNPIYKAMHACGCSSRRKLSKTHRIPAGKKLNDKQVNSVVNLLIRWIVREHNFYLEEKRAQQKNLKEFS